MSDVLFCNEKLLVSCPQGLELVDVDTLKTQALLDPVDFSPFFVQRPVKQPPSSLFYIENDLFLVCYKGTPIFMVFHIL